jgi:predicted small secreted protein
MKKIFAVIIAFGFMSLSACVNTVDGVGKDLEIIGESIEKSADHLQKKFGKKEDKE